MTDLFQRWNKQPDFSLLLPRLDKWFSTERGAEILASQQVIIDELLSTCFGYHLLQLSVSQSACLFAGSRVQNNFHADPLPFSGSNISADKLISNFEQLPFESESLDVVLLHHAQEFVENPHELLREIQRVVIPGGHIIIVGFNPWSALGFYARLARFSPKSIWHNHLIARRRIKDWLGLLGFETQSSYFGYHSPQIFDRIDKPFIKKALRMWPLGNFYAISAIKQVATMTPTRPLWHTPSNRFAGLAPVKQRVSSKAE